MKIQPQLLKYTDIDTTVMSQNSKGAWVPARPMPYLYSGWRSLKNRFKLAYGVFTGKYDAFDWMND